MAGNVLFLENREKTALWERVARQLLERGHTVHWIVQNPAFAPKNSGVVHVLPFPRKNELDDDISVLDDFSLLSGDRGRNYFQTGHAHYRYYHYQIAKILDSVLPSIVFGEATLFHELLTIGLTRERAIPFINPLGERYQGNRFLLTFADTQEIYLGGPDRMAESDALDLAKLIATRKIRPNYMVVKTGIAKKLHRAQWALTRGRVWLERLHGEVYNTPSLTRKFNLERQKREAIRQWSARASVPLDGEVSILYPLQMQPEANIDIWGQPYSDQLGVILRIAAALPFGASVSIKSNPKIKYEITPQMLAAAEEKNRNPKIRLLPLEMKMKRAQEMTIGSITVSGTVGHEAVFGLGRCLSLRHPILSKHFHQFAADTPEAAVQRLLGEPEAGIGNVEIGSKLAKQLYDSSFEGIILDPFNFPEVLNEGNIKKITDGLEAAIYQALA